MELVRTVSSSRRSGRWAFWQTIKCIVFLAAIPGCAGPSGGTDSIACDALEVADFDGQVVVEIEGTISSPIKNIQVGETCNFEGEDSTLVLSLMYRIHADNSAGGLAVGEVKMENNRVAFLTQSFLGEVVCEPLTEVCGDQLAVLGPTLVARLKDIRISN